MYIKNQWYLVCLIDELAQTNPLPKKIIGENVVVFKSKKGVINVVEDRCCHRNVKLSLGYVKDDCIKCAYHGWEFNGDGKCVSIPSLPDDSFVPATACVKAYKVRIHNNMVWAFFGEGVLAEKVSLPLMPEMVNKPYVFNYHILKGDIKLVAESLIDPYHIDHVHRNSINTFMGNLSRKQIDFHIDVAQSSMTGNYYRINQGNFFEKYYFGFDKEIKTNFGFWFPHTSKLEIHFPLKNRTLFIYEHFYPTEGDKICMLQITLWDNIFKGFDWFAKWFMLRKSNKIVEEDIAFLESNKHYHDTLNVRDLLIKSDKVSIEFAKLWRMNTQQLTDESVLTPLTSDQTT